MTNGWRGPTSYNGRFDAGPALRRRRSPDLFRDFNVCVMNITNISDYRVLMNQATVIRACAMTGPSSGNQRHAEWHRPHPGSASSSG